MNQENNYFNQQSNNGMFNNQNVNNEYQQNQNIRQNNNIHLQPINQNNFSYDNEKLNKFKIIGIIAVLAVVLFVGIMLLGSGGSSQLNSGTKNGTTVSQGKELKIKSDYVDINLTVESVERNVKLSDMLGEEEFFTKIKISIVNNEKDDSFNSTFIAYELFDQNKNLLEDSSCLNEIWMSMYDVNDAIKAEIPANSTDSGYLYCRDDGNMGKILGITSFTAFDEELIQQGHLKSTDSDIFYVSLK